MELRAGDDVPIGPTTRLECKVCWHVYDPAEGDPVWQIPPGTPFTDLPDHWSCPNCSTAKDGFLVLQDD
jgi:rubredoxin